MKKIFFCMAFTAAMASSCKESFLDVPPQGPIVTEEVLSNRAGVKALLLGAYHDLGGIPRDNAYWAATGTNWIWGDITAGDAYRGGINDPGDQPEGNAIEIFQTNATMGFLIIKFGVIYDGVARSNSAIRAANKATDMTDAEKKAAFSEARFLRGHFHFDAKKMWNKVPYIDENVTDFKVSNETDIWPNIEADFRFAFDNLPETQDLKGKPNKWAAACYLAKAYMFQKKYAEAKSLLEKIISNGKNSSGIPYALNPCFWDNFDATKENSPEAVFQIQFSVNDKSMGFNSNLGDVANTPASYPPASYGFSWKQPSFNLVNAYKTDANGLPLLTTFNNVNMKNDMGIESNECSYITYQGTVDPRLDWTVGRRNIPYLDYNSGAPNPGKDWVNDQAFGGPYVNKKGVYRNSEFGVFSDYYANGYLTTSAVNYTLIRFADVLLWAAECEVEVGNLNKARDYVNQIRTRAKTGCTEPIDFTNDCHSGTYPSANYSMDIYKTAWTSQNTARDAVRFERRLELALEGHRFFDLVRWGIAADYINNYFNVEKTRLTHLANAVFIPNKHEYFPLPQQEIDLSIKDGVKLLKQNPGY